MKLSLLPLLLSLSAHAQVGSISSAGTYRMAMVLSFNNLSGVVQDLMGEGK